MPYGHTLLKVTLPDHWLGEVAALRTVTPAPDVHALLASALRQPIGSPPLSQLAKPGQTAAVIVDDYTRKTPVRQFLPLVLEQLLAAGIGQRDIRIVIALGTHRPMTEAEIVAKVGADVATQLEIVNAPGTSESDVVYLGASSSGIPAWINRAVAEADVRVGLGMITPHMDAGFSGGAKIILPGVCGVRTVDAFHAASAFTPENQLGSAAAPLRRSLEQFVAERVPLHFIVNVILTPDGEIVQCVAGHCIEAHRAGVKVAQAVFGVSIQRRYPIVVAGCYPYDIDWWQSAKGVWSGDRMTADGGTLVVVTAAPESHSNYSLLPHYMGRDPDELKQEIEAGRAADAKQAATGVMFGDLRKRINLVLVSDGLTPADADAMRMPYYASVEDAVADAVGRLPEAQRRGCVGVIPQAGIALPLVE